MRRTGPKTRRLTVLLLKDSIRSPKDALRAPDALQQIALQVRLPLKGEFWYAAPHVQTPWWCGFVNAVLERPLEVLSSASLSAVLFATAEGRWFAFTFGYGRSLLRPDSFVPGFGLRVALNRINERQIRSLDSRTYEELVVSTRRFTSRSSELGTFGLDVSRDLLRAVTGEPAEKQFATRLTGADSLTLNVPVQCQDLTEKCREMLVAFEDQSYKTHFGWIDHLREERDPGVISSLDAQLLDALHARNTSKLHMAAPEVLDWQDVAGFRFSGVRGEYLDLDLDEYLAALGDDAATITLQDLKHTRIGVKFTGSDQFQDRWSVYDSLVWDHSVDGQFYALVEGKWFQIESAFAKRITTFVRGIATPARLLPDAMADEREDVYNLRVATDSPTQYACLDRKLVKAEDAASQIEFCDLFSDQKAIIHVKKNTRSATLSHLFAQGTVSASALLGDGSVRKQVRDYLAKTRLSRDLVPDEDTRPIASDYTVCFAIICKQRHDWPGSLPFFSQLNLMHQVKFLRALGFGVALQQVPVMKRP